VFGETDRARIETEAALTAARNIGIRRLEADCLAELSRLALVLGDLDAARRRSMEALALANQLGLGLRTTHGLVTLGMTHLRADDRRIGVAYLTSAMRLASDQE